MKLARRQVRHLRPESDGGGGAEMPERVKRLSRAVEGSVLYPLGLEREENQGRATVTESSSTILPSQKCVFWNRMLAGYGWRRRGP